MKRIGDEFDTELTLQDNVLIGSKFFTPHELRRGDKAWEIEILQKLSQEMSFIPTILDYKFEGTAWEFALENIGNMLPVEFYVADMIDHPSDLNLKKMYAIANNILYKWRGMINDFALRNNVLIKINGFWDGTVINQDKKLYFMNIQNLEVTRVKEIENFIIPHETGDLNTVMRWMYKLSYTTQHFEKILDIQKKNKNELHYLKSRCEVMLDKKNKQLAKSISIDTIKATLGEAKYQFYFGDSDG